MKMVRCRKRNFRLTLLRLMKKMLKRSKKMLKKSTTLRVSQQVISGTHLSNQNSCDMSVIAETSHVFDSKQSRRSGESPQQSLMASFKNCLSVKTAPLFVTFGQGTSPLVDFDFLLELMELMELMELIEFLFFPLSFPLPLSPYVCHQTIVRSPAREPLRPNCEERWPVTEQPKPMANSGSLSAVRTIESPSNIISGTVMTVKSRPLSTMHSSRPSYSVPSSLLMWHLAPSDVVSFSGSTPSLTLSAIEYGSRPEHFHPMKA